MVMKLQVFMIKNVNSNYNYLAVISLDSAHKKDQSHYP